MTKSNPFRYFKTSPEIIRLAVMMYVRFPLSLRNVEDLLHERGMDISHETIRYWWNRFGPMFAADIKRKRIQSLRRHSKWRQHLDEMFVKINGKTHYLWRAESFHLPFRRRERAMQCFRLIQSCKVCLHPRLGSQPLQPGT